MSTSRMSKSRKLVLLLSLNKDFLFFFLNDGKRKAEIDISFVEW